MTAYPTFEKGKARIITCNSTINGALNMSDHDPAYWQEKHSPSEPVLITIRHEQRGRKRVRVTQEVCRRRKSDVRIADAIDEVGSQRAAAWINIAYRSVADDVGYTFMNLERGISPPTTGDSGNASEFICEARHAYRKWAEKCHDYKINLDAVVAVVCLGNSLSHTDKVFRKRNGWARVNLTDGLEQFNGIMGWNYVL